MASLDDGDVEMGVEEQSSCVEAGTSEPSATDTLRCSADEQV